MTVPLTGFALQAEQRRAVVRAAREFGSSPLAVAHFAVDTVGLFLRAGNFRPLGRFLEKAEHAFAFEAAEATSLSLHSVQGVLRLVLVAALAMTAAQVVSAVMRSAGDGAVSSARWLIGLLTRRWARPWWRAITLSPLSAFPDQSCSAQPLLILAVVAGRGPGQPTCSLVRLVPARVQ